MFPYNKKRDYFAYLDYAGFQCIPIYPLIFPVICLNFHPLLLPILPLTYTLGKFNNDQLISHLPHCDVEGNHRTEKAHRVMESIHIPHS